MASAPLFRAAAGAPAANDEFFVFVHALGGWDVTLCTDARWEERGLVNPASTMNTDVSLLRQWTNAKTALADGAFSFQPVRPPNSPFVFGPALGNLIQHASRLTVINGIATNTVSHADGQTFAVTGRHLNGGRPNQASVDACLANEFGKEQLLPCVSVQFPSYSVGSQMDPRATPLRISNIGTVAQSLDRATLYDTPAERDAVTALLSEEAQELAAISSDPRAMQSFAIQFQALRNILAKNLKDDFSAASLTARHPELNIAKLRFQSSAAVNTAFAIEAFRHNIARCVSFTFGGFDTHFGNYRSHALVQQEMFDTLAALIDQLDAIPHPTLAGSTLSDHTHILVTSDFCRTPQINIAGGRDHYPNGSAIIVSPKFRGAKLVGRSDPEQLLPAGGAQFADGNRPIGPPDVLATLVKAFGVDSQKYFREGELIPGILK